jgi:hypothetical protein
MVLLEFVDAAFEFFAGSTERFQETLRTGKMEALSEELQGNPVTAEKVEKALVVNIDPVSKEQVVWFKEKIREDDREWLQKLILALGGTKNLSPGEKIYIMQGEQKGIEVHGCTFELFFPPYKISKKRLF